MRRFCSYLASVLLATTGCGSGPSAVEGIDFDADDASRLAMEAHDANGDGFLDESELATAPGIYRYRDLYDADKDGRVSAAEIEQRIGSWNDRPIGLRGLRLTLLYGGRPLKDAEVTLVPEPYLGDEPIEATGKTNGSGVAHVSIPVEALPEDLRAARVRGVYAGTYRVEVRHPQVKLPAKYNEQTTLGVEVARDTTSQAELSLERN